MLPGACQIALLLVLCRPLLQLLRYPELRQKAIDRLRHISGSSGRLQRLLQSEQWLCHLTASPVCQLRPLQLARIGITIFLINAVPAHKLPVLRLCPDFFALDAELQYIVFQLIHGIRQKAARLLEEACFQAAKDIFIAPAAAAGTDGKG